MIFRAGCEELEKKENVFQVYFTGCAGDILVGKYNDGTPAARDQVRPADPGGHGGRDCGHAWTPADSIQWRSTEVKLPLYEGPQTHGRREPARMADPKVDAGNRLELGAMFLAFAERMDRPLTLSGLQIGACTSSISPANVWWTINCSPSVRRRATSWP